jgi:hypothetical protein
VGAGSGQLVRVLRPLRKAIYELRGDVLKVAHNDPTTKKRPEAFKGASYVETWKRIK